MNHLTLADIGAAPARPQYPSKKLEEMTEAELSIFRKRCTIAVELAAAKTRKKVADAKAERFENEARQVLSEFNRRLDELYKGRWTSGQQKALYDWCAAEFEKHRVVVRKARAESEKAGDIMNKQALAWVKADPRAPVYAALVRSLYPTGEDVLAVLALCPRLFLMKKPAAAAFPLPPVAIPEPPTVVTPFEPSPLVPASIQIVRWPAPSTFSMTRP